MINLNETVSDRAEELLDMDEAAFREAWNEIVGEPPSVILPRDQMVAILEETIDDLPPPAADA